MKRLQLIPVAIAVFAVAVFATLARIASNGASFEAEAWQNNPEFRVDELSIRNEMVNDLVAKRLPPGIAESEVLNLLGPPTFESTHRLEYWVNDDYGQWWESNLSPDPLRYQYLFLDFNSNHKLISAKRVNRK